MNAPKIICHNNMQPHACAGCHPKALLKFSTFDSESASCASKLAASMGPMGLRPVWPFMLAPSGRSWQTHAGGCCQHVWALCHALGCTLPGSFGVLTLFGGHLGISLPQLGFWRFFAVFGQLPIGPWWVLGLAKWLNLFSRVPTTTSQPSTSAQKQVVANHGCCKTPFSFQKECGDSYPCLLV